MVQGRRRKIRALPEYVETYRNQPSDARDNNIKAVDAFHRWRQTSASFELIGVLSVLRLRWSQMLCMEPYEPSVFCAGRGGGRPAACQAGSVGAPPVRSPETELSQQ